MDNKKKINITREWQGWCTMVVISHLQRGREVPGCGICALDLTHSRVCGRAPGVEVVARYRKRYGLRRDWRPRNRCWRYVELEKRIRTRSHNVPQHRNAAAQIRLEQCLTVAEIGVRIRRPQPVETYHAVGPYGHAARQTAACMCGFTARSHVQLRRGAP